MFEPAWPVGHGEQRHRSLLRSASALARVAMEAGGDHVLPDVAATPRQRHHVVAGQVLATGFATAVQAQVLVAGEQGDIGQGRGRVQRMGTRMAACGDDRMQLHYALFAGAAAGAAMHAQAGITEGPGDRAAHIPAGGRLPAHPVQYPAVRVERQPPHRVQAKRESVRLHWNNSLYRSYESRTEKPRVGKEGGRTWRTRWG